MNKLKCFGREHVIANTSPMPGNRAFVDRTNNTYRFKEGTVTVKHYHGYHDGFPSWWCEVDDMPGNFILKRSLDLSPSRKIESKAVQLKSPLTGKVRDVEITTMEEWQSAVKELEFGGMPIFWDNGDFWIATKGFRQIGSNLYVRLAGKCLLRDAADFGYVPQGVRGRTPRYAKYQSIKNALAGKYRQFGKSCDELFRVYRTLDALKRSYATISIAKRDEVVEQAAPAPQVNVSVEVDLREHSLKIAKEFYEEKGIAATEEMIRSMQDTICRKFWTSRLKRRIMVSAADVDSCFDAETRLDAVLKFIQN